LQRSEDLTYGVVTELPGGEPSATELNRQLTNLLTSVSSISNQFNNVELNNDQWSNNWNFQPVRCRSFLSFRSSLKAPCSSNVER
jgi:hypothetical protein